MKKELFFDAASTTPLDPRVEEAMIEAREYWGNENSKHLAGFEARKQFDRHMSTIAEVLQVSPDRLAVTYSGTDSNRRVIHSVAKRVGLDRCFCSAVEHSSILDEMGEGNRFNIQGSIFNIQDPKLICLMQANSETGTIYGAEALKSQYPESLLLRDYSQSYAKGLQPDFQYADFGTFSPQKIYGPKMVGLTYLRDPQNFQEISKDSHTKSIPQVAGMAKAFELHASEGPDYLQKIQKWDAQIIDYIRENIPDVKFHEEEKDRVKGLINVAFKGLRGGELMTVLSEQEQIAISTGSACTSDIMSPTEVIKHLEPDPTWQYPIRLGLHKYLTDQSVSDFCEMLGHYVGELRKK